MNGKWTDIDGWLKGQTGPVSKQAVLDYLKANEVRVEERVKGKQVDHALVAELTAKVAAAQEKARGSEAVSPVKEGDRVATVGSAASRGGYSYSTGKIYEAKRAGDGLLYWKKAGEFGGERSGRSAKFIQELKAQAQYPWSDTAAHNVRVAQTFTLGGVRATNDALDLYRAQTQLDAAKRGTGTPTKFEKYKLPGGSNYREVLLTLPVETARDRLIAELHGIDRALDADPEQRERLMPRHGDPLREPDGDSGSQHAVPRQEPRRQDPRRQPAHQALRRDLPDPHHRPKVANVVYDAIAVMLLRHLTPKTAQKTSVICAPQKPQNGPGNPPICTALSAVVG
jgi:hypothetical protein